MTRYTFTAHHIVSARQAYAHLPCFLRPGYLCDFKVPGQHRHLWHGIGEVMTSGHGPGRPCPVPACSGQPLPGERRFSSALGNRVFRSIVLLLFLQKQNLATAIYLFGLGTLLTGLGLKHIRIRSHHDLASALVTSLLLGRPWWSPTSPTCLPLSVFTITSDQHRCRIPPLL